MSFEGETRFGVVFGSFWSGVSLFCFLGGWGGKGMFFGFPSLRFMFLNSFLVSGQLSIKETQFSVKVH